MSTEETYKTIPYGWYRIASLTDLTAETDHKFVTYRLCRTFELSLDANGNVVVTSNNRKRTWEYGIALGQVIVWYGPENAKSPFPAFAPSTDYQCVSRPWSLYLCAAMCEIVENGGDTAHFAVVHKTAHTAENGRARVLDNGFLEIKQDLIAYSMNIRNRTTITVFCPGIGETHAVGPGADYVIAGMVTPIDEDHCEDFNIVRTKRWWGLGWLLNWILYFIVVAEIKRDIIIWEHKVYREQPVLCDGDGPIAEFRRWYRGFMPSRYQSCNNP